MKGPGRPTHTAVARRRRKIALFLFTSAARDDMVARLAELVKAGERAVRSDLDALRGDFEGDPETLPRDLAVAIEGADSFKLLKATGKRVMLEMVRGTVDRELGRALVDALREQRHVLRNEREEESHTALMAIDVLTPQEQAVLEKYRASLTPPSLKPGEFPAPPEGAPLPVDFDATPPAAGTP